MIIRDRFFYFVQSFSVLETCKIQVCDRNIQSIRFVLILLGVIGDNLACCDLPRRSYRTMFNNLTLIGHLGE